MGEYFNNLQKTAGEKLTEVAGITADKQKEQKEYSYYVGDPSSPKITQGETKVPDDATFGEKGIREKLTMEKLDRTEEYSVSKYLLYYVCGIILAFCIIYTINYSATRQVNGGRIVGYLWGFFTFFTLYTIFENSKISDKGSNVTSFLANIKNKKSSGLAILGVSVLTLELLKYLSLYFNVEKDDKTGITSISNNVLYYNSFAAFTSLQVLLLIFLSLYYFYTPVNKKTYSLIIFLCMFCFCIPLLVNFYLGSENYKANMLMSFYIVSSILVVTTVVLPLVNYLVNPVDKLTLNIFGQDDYVADFKPYDPTNETFTTTNAISEDIDSYYESLRNILESYIDKNTGEFDEKIKFLNENGEEILDMLAPEESRKFNRKSLNTIYTSAAGGNINGLQFMRNAGLDNIVGLNKGDSEKAQEKHVKNIDMGLNLRRTKRSVGGADEGPITNWESGEGRHGGTVDITGALAEVDEGKVVNVAEHKKKSNEVVYTKKGYENEFHNKLPPKVFGYKFLATLLVILLNLANISIAIGTSFIDVPLRPTTTKKSDRITKNYGIAFGVLLGSSVIFIVLYFKFESLKKWYYELFLFSINAGCIITCGLFSHRIHEKALISTSKKTSPKVFFDYSSTWANIIVFGSILLPLLIMSLYKLDGLSSTLVYLFSILIISSTYIYFPFQKNNTTADGTNPKENISTVSLFKISYVFSSFIILFYSLMRFSQFARFDIVKGNKKKDLRTKVKGDLDANDVDTVRADAAKNLKGYDEIVEKMNANTKNEEMATLIQNGINVGMDKRIGELIDIQIRDNEKTGTETTSQDQVKNIFEKFLGNKYKDPPPPPPPAS